MSFDSPPATPTFPAAFLNVKTEIQLNNVWTDISGFVYADTSTIGRGHPDESTTASSSTYTATLNNSDGRFSQLYPNGPYYPHLGLNTPLRTSIPEGASYLRLEGDSASYASTPLASVGSQLSTGLDIQVDATPDNWFASQILAAQYASAVGDRGWVFGITSAGVLYLLVWNAGAISEFQCPVSFSANGSGGNVQVNPHQRMSVRCVLNASAGTATFYTGSYCSTWVQIGVCSLGATVMPWSFNSGAPFTVGCCPSNDFLAAGTSGGLNGRVHAAILSTFTGTTLANPDFTAATAGVTSFTDGTSNVWSTVGTSEVSNRKYRIHGYVAAWPQSWSPGDANALVSVSVGGKLRQMGQSQASVNSPMVRAYTRGISTSTGLAAYWPFEDLPTSTSIASGLGGAPAQFTGTPTLSNSGSFVCSNSLPVLNSALFSARVAASAVTWSANSVRFLLQVPAGGDTNNAEVVNIATSGTAGLLVVSYTTASGGSLTLAAFNAAGTSLATTAAITGVNGVLLAVQVDVQPGGSVLSVVLSALAVGAASQQTAGASVTGSVGAVQTVIVNERGANGGLVGSVFGHLAVYASYNVVTNIIGALAAWVSEPGGVRFQRLCAEESIGFRGMGNMSDTVLMGAQTQETVAALMQECADADRAMWFECRHCPGYVFRNRVSIGNQAPWVTFDYNQDHLSEDLLPTHDDQVIKNDITITNQGDGSSSEATLNDGSALSIGVVGRYDTSLSINLANDNQLIDEATWILHSLTVNEPRYTAINVDLANSLPSFAALYYLIVDADIGDRVNVVNPPVWLPPGVIDQIIQGASEPVSQKDLRESWNGVPATPFNVMYLDDPVYGRGDTDGSTLAVAEPTGTATSLQVATSNSLSPLWTTNAADLPLNFVLGGEVITVGTITGSSSPQTFSGITRSVNGVVKAQTAGTDIRLAVQPTLSL